MYLQRVAHSSLLILLISSAGVSFSRDFIPDLARTPGVINPEVTQANLHETICAPGWTRSIRPPVSYTYQLKMQQMKEQQLSGKAVEYNEDHRVPLCAGGHPRDPRNLWPQPRHGKWSANAKYKLERSVCRAICGGSITLEEGQQIFLQPDWTIEYKKFFKLK
jgi:hypothetical protein